MTLILLIIFLLSTMAFTLSAICGGGAGLILMPILGRLMPLSQVPVALSIGTFTSSASRLAIFYRNIHWPIVKVFVPVAIPFVWLGAYLLKFINPAYLEIGMGLFLISNIYFLIKNTSNMVHADSPPKLTLMLIGGLAGFISGLTGAVGLIFNKFYLRFDLSNEEIIATRAANDILIHLLKIVLYAFLGLMNAYNFGIGLSVALAAVVSSLLAKFLLPKISKLLFSRIAYISMGLAGVIMLNHAVSAVMLQNQMTISSSIEEKGLETKLHWQNADLALEFTYDDGFEFEQIIDISELSREHQNFIKQKVADKIVLEKVHTFNGSYYEVYYYTKHQLTDKIEFK